MFLVERFVFACFFQTFLDIERDEIVGEIGAYAVEIFGVFAPFVIGGDADGGVGGKGGILSGH